MTIEIVDFPINSMVIFNSYVKLPEGRLLDPNSWMVYFMENPLKMDDLGIPIICSIVGRDDDQPVDWVSVKKGCPKPESQGCSHAVSMVALGVQYSIV